MKRLTAKDAKNIANTVARKKVEERQRLEEVARELERKKHIDRDLAARQKIKLENILQKLIRAAIDGRQYCYHKQIEDELCKRLVNKKIQVRKMVSLNVAGRGLVHIYASSLAKFKRLDAKVSALQITYRSKRHRILYDTKKYQRRGSYQQRLLELDNSLKEKLIELEARRSELIQEIDSPNDASRGAKALLEISWRETEGDAAGFGAEWKVDGKLLKALSGNVAQKLLSKIETFIRKEAEAGKLKTTLQMDLDSGLWWSLSLGADKCITSVTNLCTGVPKHDRGLSPADLEKLLAYLGYQVFRENNALHVTWA